MRWWIAVSLAEVLSSVRDLETDPRAPGRYAQYEVIYATVQKPVMPGDIFVGGFVGNIISFLFDDKNTRGLYSDLRSFRFTYCSIVSLGPFVFNSLTPSDAYMRQQTNHHSFR